VLRTIDETFLESRRILKDAHEKQDQGKRGAFRPVGDHYVKGEVILLGTMLYFSNDFDVGIAPGMHVYLAEHVGPQTLEELRSNVIRDLGPIKTALGAEEYVVGMLSEDEQDRFRTVVIASPSLKNILAYAQIRKKVGAGASE
jgi:hypothetical protein